MDVEDNPQTDRIILLSPVETVVEAKPQDVTPAPETVQELSEVQKAHNERLDEAYFKSLEKFLAVGNHATQNTFRARRIEQ